MKILTTQAPEGSKCGGCNWVTISRYYLDNTPEEDALCAECFLETLMNQNAVIT